MPRNYRRGEVRANVVRARTVAPSRAPLCGTPPASASAQSALCCLQVNLTRSAPQLMGSDRRGAPGERERIRDRRASLSAARTISSRRRRSSFRPCLESTIPLRAFFERRARGRKRRADFSEGRPEREIDREKYRPSVRSSCTKCYVAEDSVVYVVRLRGFLELSRVRRTYRT